MLSKRLFNYGAVKLFLEKFRPRIETNWVYPKPFVVVNEQHEKDVKASPPRSVQGNVLGPLGKGLVPSLAWTGPVAPPSPVSHSELVSVVLVKGDSDAPVGPDKETPGSIEQSGNGSKTSNSQGADDGKKTGGKDETDMDQSVVGSWKDWSVRQGSVEETPEIATPKHYSSCWGNFVKPSEPAVPGSSKPSVKNNVYADLISHPQDSGFIGALNVPENWNYVKQKISIPSQSDCEKVPGSPQVSSSDDRCSTQHVYGTSGTASPGYESGHANSLKVPGEGKQDGTQMLNVNDGSLNMLTHKASLGSENESEPGLKLVAPYLPPENISSEINEVSPAAGMESVPSQSGLGANAQYITSETISPATQEASPVTGIEFVPPSQTSLQAKSPYITPETISPVIQEESSWSRNISVPPQSGLKAAAPYTSPETIYPVAQEASPVRGMESVPLSQTSLHAKALYITPETISPVIQEASFQTGLKGAAPYTTPEIISPATQKASPTIEKKFEPSKSALKAVASNITYEYISPERNFTVSSESCVTNIYNSLKKPPIMNSGNGAPKSAPDASYVSYSASYLLSQDTSVNLARSVREPGSVSSPVREPLTKPAYGIKRTSHKWSSQKGRLPHLDVCKSGCTYKRVEKGPTKCKKCGGVKKGGGCAKNTCGDPCSGEGQPKCQESQETLATCPGKKKGGGSAKTMCDDSCSAEGQLKCKESQETLATCPGQKKGGGRAKTTCDDSCSGEGQPKCKESQETLATCPGKKGGGRGNLQSPDSCGGNKCSTTCGAGTSIGRINPCKKK